MKINLFNEIYGCYYSTVYHILKEAGSRELTDSEFRELVQEASKMYGFPETTNLIISSAIDLGKNEEIDDNKDAWPFFDRYDKISMNYGITRDRKSRYVNRSRLNHIDGIPLSMLEKRWLKSIYSDPRIQLFLGEGQKLPDFDDIEPLFDIDDYVLFDRYSDGDPFCDEHYINMFRTVLKGVHKKARLKILFKKNSNNVLFNTDGSFEFQIDGGIGTIYIEPDYLEYSERDDKFRLYGTNPRFGRNIVNISSIESCSVVERYESSSEERKTWENRHFQRNVVFELKDDNNALERFLLSFSHYEKAAEYIDERKCYRIRVAYDETDETDIVIRTLSFGPHVKVIAPALFVDLIRDRLRQQISLRSFKT